MKTMKVDKFRRKERFGQMSFECRHFEVGQNDFFVEKSRKVDFHVMRKLVFNTSVDSFGVVNQPWKKCVSAKVISRSQSKGFKKDLKLKLWIKDSRNIGWPEWALFT